VYWSKESRGSIAGGQSADDAHVTMFSEERIRDAYRRTFIAVVERFIRSMKTECARQRRGSVEFLGGTGACGSAPRSSP
jgi:hypothetical protein